MSYYIIITIIAIYFIFGHNFQHDPGSGYRAAHTGTENSSQVQFVCFWGGVLDDRFQCHCFCAETWHSLVLSLYPKFTNLPFTFAVKLDFYFDNTRKD